MSNQARQEKKEKDKQDQDEGQLTRDMKDKDPWRKKQQMAKPGDEEPKKES